jgi:UDP-N-acetylglucosamine 2-epimerase
MKIMTIMGTRPEIIRLSQIIPKLDKYFEHVLVYTGQNFDKDLKEVFFEEMKIRKPDYDLNKEEKFGFDFISFLFKELPDIIDKELPDAVLVLGDTNSSLAAYIAKRKKIPIIHMEAGNRCYNDEVPEEINRRIIDTLSDFLLPYTQRSREQLLAEGYDPKRIIVTGNPITEVISENKEKIESSNILTKLDLDKKDYILVTIHREENVTNKKRLMNIISYLKDLSNKYKVIVSTHPKTKDMITKEEYSLKGNLTFSKPFGFFDFVRLERDSLCVFTDSGTVQEECSILKTPCVLMRNSTERPELVETGSVIVCGTDTKQLKDSLEMAIKLNMGEIPLDYKDKNVSDKIIKIMMRIKNV